MANTSVAGGAKRPGGLGRLFIRKSVEQMHAEHEAGELKKTLGPLNLVLLGIGCIIGTGIFVLTGRAAAEFAGPGIMISFVITGTLCALVALSYAELASAIPVSGSAYSYSYASMGEIVAWIMGLLLVLEYGLAASTVAVGWSGYVVSFLHEPLGVTFPHALSQAPGSLVAMQDIAFTVTNPTVNLDGQLATFNGQTVLLNAPAGADAVAATLQGAHAIEIGEYDAIGRETIDLTAQHSAILTAAAEGTNQITRELMQLPQGSALTFIDGAGARAEISGDAVQALVQQNAAGQAVHSVFNLPAVIALAAVTCLLVVGISESALVNNIVVFIKVFVVIAFILVGAVFVNTDLWTPLVPNQIPAPPPGAEPSLWSQIATAAWNVVTGENTGRYGIGGPSQARPLSSSPISASKPSPLRAQSRRTRRATCRSGFSVRC